MKKAHTINEAFEVKGIDYAIAKRSWEHLRYDLDKILDGSKVKERTYKGHKIGLKKVGDQNLMFITFDLIKKGFGFQGTEEELLNSDKNRFHSFVLEGEFRTLRRFYIAEISDISMFLDRKSLAWIQFEDWFWGPTIPRDFHYSSGGMSRLPEEYCAAFYDYARKLCERGEA